MNFENNILYLYCVNGFSIPAASQLIIKYNNTCVCVCVHLYSIIYANGQHERESCNGQTKFIAQEK